MDRMNVVDREIVFNRTACLRELVRGEAAERQVEASVQRGARRDRAQALVHYYTGLSEALPKQVQPEMIDELKSIKGLLEQRLAQTAGGGLNAGETTNMLDALDVAIRVLGVL